MRDKILYEISCIEEEYKSVPIQKLAQDYKINMNAKQSYNLIVRQLLKKELSAESWENLSKGKFDIRTIVLEKYGGPKESISLPMFKYCEIINETWEGSTLRKYLLDRVFLFVVFRYTSHRDCRIETIKPWTMSTDVLDTEIKQMWLKTVECIANGKIVKYVDANGRRHTYFPASTDNAYMHVRPHARSSNDTIPLPVADELTGAKEYQKQSFWLNKNFITKIITKD